MSKKRKIPLFAKILYYGLAILMILGAYEIYKFWYEDYLMSTPRIIEAVSTNYTEEQPLEGILLWDEQLIYAPKNGILTYPSPRPRMVAKGEMLAALDGRAVQAPYPAYFFPALDGQEGNWFYSRLWPDFAPFPELKPAELLENGTMMRRGDSIGKLIPQPQVLRCIAYLDSSPSLNRTLNVKDAFLKIKLGEENKEHKAEVVAVKYSGLKLKVYLRLPFFPPDLLKSRKFSAKVVTGIEFGVMVPDTAVITKDGKNMVFLVQGNNPVLKEIEGFPVLGNGMYDEKNFFIEKGIVPGNRLILNAGKFDPNDKNIRLWW